MNTTLKNIVGVGGDPRRFVPENRSRNWVVVGGKRVYTK